MREKLCAKRKVKVVMWNFTGWVSPCFRSTFLHSKLIFFFINSPLITLDRKLLRDDFMIANEYMEEHYCQLLFGGSQRFMCSKLKLFPGFLSMPWKVDILSEFAKWENHRYYLTNFPKVVASVLKEVRFWLKAAKVNSSATADIFTHLPVIGLIIDEEILLRYAGEARERNLNQIAKNYFIWPNTFLSYILRFLLHHFSLIPTLLPKRGSFRCAEKSVVEQFLLSEISGNTITIEYVLLSSCWVGSVRSRSIVSPSVCINTFILTNQFNSEVVDQAEGFLHQLLNV